MSYESGEGPLKNGWIYLMGIKQKNDWFFVQTFIIDKIRKLEKLDLFSNQGNQENSRRIYNLVDIFDSSIYE